MDMPLAFFPEIMQAAMETGSLASTKGWNIEAQTMNAEFWEETGKAIEAMESPFSVKQADFDADEALNIFSDAACDTQKATWAFCSGQHSKSGYSKTASRFSSTNFGRQQRHLSSQQKERSHAHFGQTTQASCLPCVHGTGLWRSYRPMTGVVCISLLCCEERRVKTQVEDPPARRKGFSLMLQQNVLQ